MKLRTKLCDLLGIEYPIIQAGMGGQRKGPPWASAHLVAAVSNAGGLGVLGGSQKSPEMLRQWIREIRQETNKPFAVDIINPSIVPDKDYDPREMVRNIPKPYLDWQANMMKKYHIPEPTMSPTYDFPPLTREAFQRQVDVLLEEKVPVIAVAIGEPSPVVQAIRKAGMNTKVIGLTGNVKSALRSAAAGPDIIIATGTEAAGHSPRIGGLAVLPQIMDAVHAKYPNILIGYAGGISTGRQIAAVLTMGAVGVWVGTRFLACTDADAVWDWHKKAIVEANDEGTLRFADGGDWYYTEIYLGGAPKTLLVFGTMGVIQVGFLLLVTLRWKISGHGAAIGSLAVFLWSLYGAAAAPALLAIPLVAWARVRIQRHTIAQTVAGSLAGMCITLAFVLLIL